MKAKQKLIQYISLFYNGQLRDRGEALFQCPLPMLNVEYDICECVTEFLWTKDFLKEIRQNRFLQKPISVLLNIQEQISLLKQMILKRNNHINVKYHFIRKVIQCGTIVFKYVKSNENNSDLLKKAKGKELFLLFRNTLIVLIALVSKAIRRCE